MKILAKIKKRPYILSILFAMLIIGIVYAAEYYQVNSGATSTINEWSVCQKVTNNNALAIFVPTKTADEWTAFRTYATGVTLAICCQDSDADGYGVAGYSGIANGCTYDGDDCNDACATCYPGSTAYTTSADGLDQDCNGVIDNTSRAYTIVELTTTVTYCSTVCTSYTLSCESVGTDADGTNGYCRNGGENIFTCQTGGCTCALQVSNLTGCTGLAKCRCYQTRYY